MLQRLLLVHLLFLFLISQTTTENVLAYELPSREISGWKSSKHKICVQVEVSVKGNFCIIASGYFYMTIGSEFQDLRIPVICGNKFKFIFYLKNGSLIMKQFSTEGNLPCDDVNGSVCGTYHKYCSQKIHLASRFPKASNQHFITPICFILSFSVLVLMAVLVFKRKSIFRVFGYGELTSVDELNIEGLMRIPGESGEVWNSGI